MPDPAKPVTYLNPKDEYVRSPEKVTISALANKWHHEDRDGYSEPWLKKRCSKEGWRNLRLAHWERARSVTIAKELDDTAEAHATVIKRYTTLLDGMMGGAVRYLKQFEPPEGTPPEERSTFMPPFKGPGEAAAVLQKCIELDRKVRGMDVQKIADVTGEDIATDYYSEAGDEELERIIAEADAVSGESAG